MRSPSSSSSQHSTVFILHSTFPSSNPSLPLSQAPRNRQHLLLLLKSKQNPPSTEYGTFWTPADGPATCNISSTGRVTGQRKDPGWSVMFWIPPFWPSSIRTTQTGPHPEAEAGPVTIVGRQEPPLEEGVLSGNHNHHQRHSPDHNHLITAHHHLSPLIKITISTHSSQAVTVWSQTLHVVLT